MDVINLSNKQAMSLIPKTNISVYVWFPRDNDLPDMYWSDVWQSLLALSACLTSILLHSFLSLEILFLTFMRLRSLDGQRPKIWILSCQLQLLFWHIWLGDYYSTFLFTSAFQFINVSGLLVTGITKILPTRGRWRCIWMKLLCRLGERAQVPRRQLHRNL